MTRRRNRVRVWKGHGDLFFWRCYVETCPAPINASQGTSFFWEIAQRFADEHAREWHRPRRHVPYDAPTPPGGTHFDWSDTGMHVRVREED